MQVNTSIGELAVYATIDGEGREFILRPSFYAVSRIGTPEQIKSICNACIDCLVALERGYVRKSWVYDCLSVINACCDDDVPISVFGGWKQHLRDGQWRLEFYEGAVSAKECIVLANHLIRWGIVGDPSDKAKKSEVGKKKSLFDPRDYVGAAMAHLHLPKSDAWALTMTEFQRAMDSKFPDDQSAVKESQDVSQEDYDKLMAQHDEIMAKKALKDG